MTDHARHLNQLQQLLERIRAGDSRARDELFCSILKRMEFLAKRMIRDFPKVRRSCEPEDVVQNALIRLLGSLRDVQPADAKQFLGLVAVQLRRELLDVARKVSGPKGRPPCRTAISDEDSDVMAIEPPAAPEESADLDNWCVFHQEVERLPLEEREVVSLIFYHGWSQLEVAQLLQMSERTVRRRWDTARAKLQALLQDR